MARELTGRLVSFVLNDHEFFYLIGSSADVELWRWKLAQKARIPASIGTVNLMPSLTRLTHGSCPPTTSALSIGGAVPTGYRSPR